MTILELSTGWASEVREFSSERSKVSERPTVASIQGKVKVRPNANETWYESGIEKDFLSLCVSENRVVSAIAQPFTLHFKDKLAKAPRRYTPDFLIEVDPLLDSTWSVHLTKKILVEVKPLAKLFRDRRKLLPKFHAARQWCIENEAQFFVFTDKTTSDLELKTARMLERGLLSIPNKKTETDLETILNTYGGLYLEGLLGMLQDKGNDKRSCVDAVMRRISIGELWAPLFEGLKPHTMLRYIHEPL